MSAESKLTQTARNVHDKESAASSDVEMPDVTDKNHAECPSADATKRADESSVDSEETDVNMADKGAEVVKNAGNMTSKNQFAAADTDEKHAESTSPDATKTKTETEAVVPDKKAAVKSNHYFAPENQPQQQQPPPYTQPVQPQYPPQYQPQSQPQPPPQYQPPYQPQAQPQTQPVYAPNKSVITDQRPITDGGQGYDASSNTPGNTEAAAANGGGVMGWMQGKWNQYVGSTDDAKPKKKKIREWNQKAIVNWTHKDVVSWVESLASFEKYASKFPQYIDGEKLLEIEIDDLTLIITKKLWRKKFMKQIGLAKDTYAVAAELDEDEYEDDIKENDNATETRSSSSRKRQVAVNGVVGLRNLGNTCYMNTSIQILSQTPLITRYLAIRAKINNGGKDRKYPMLSAWTDLCDTIYNQTKSGYGYTTVSPAKIRNALRERDPEFGAGTQDDSSRSLGYMLDALDEEIELEIKTQKYQNQNGRFRDIKAKDSVKVLRRLSDIEIKETVNQLLADHNPNGSILRKSFDGIEQLTFECLECNEVFQQYDIFRITHLPPISNEITFKNINVVYNDNFYRIPEITVLDYCSVNVLQYHVDQYLLNEESKKLKHYDNIETIVISKNGEIQNVQNRKLSELQNMSGGIVVLVNDKKPAQNEKSNLLQFDAVIGKTGSKIQFKSALYTKYDSNAVHKFAKTNIKAQISKENDIDDEKYDYYVVYNDNVFSTKELKQANFKKSMHIHGGINLMVILKVNRQNEGYCYDIKNINKLLVREVQMRYRNSSILDALQKEESFWNAMQNDIENESEEEFNDKLIKISETLHVYGTREKIRNSIKKYLFNTFNKCSVSNCRNLTNLDDCLTEYEKARIYDDTSYKYRCPHCNSGSNSKFVKITKKIVYSPPIFLIHLDRYGKNVNTNYRRKQSAPSYEIGQQIMVNYGHRAYKAQILNVNSKGMKIEYLDDAQQEWIPKSKYSTKLPSYKSSTNSYNSYGYRSNKLGHDISYNAKLTWPQSSNNEHKLYGISNHSGSTDGGHYTATVYSSTNDRWYGISDSYVSDRNIHPLNKTADATILAYVRND